MRALAGCLPKEFSFPENPVWCQNIPLDVKIVGFGYPPKFIRSKPLGDFCVFANDLGFPAKVKQYSDSEVQQAFQNSDPTYYEFLSEVAYRDYLRQHGGVTFLRVKDNDSAAELSVASAAPAKIPAAAAAVVQPTLTPVAQPAQLEALNPLAQDLLGACNQKPATASGAVGNPRAFHRQPPVSGGDAVVEVQSLLGKKPK